MDKSMFGFWHMFGYFLVRVLAYVRVLSCSGCSGISVENLCKRVWESLWGKSGKNCGKVDSAKSLVEKVGQKQVLHGMVEKFYHGFSTQVFLCKRWVLHNFHRAYYYDYYFLYRGKEI